MSKKFVRPSTKVNGTPEAVQVANVTAPEIETTAAPEAVQVANTFVTYDEMVRDSKGHNFPKKIVPLKSERGYLVDDEVNNELMTLSVEDLTYLSLSFEPKDIEKYITRMDTNRLIKSARVFTADDKKCYIYIALDKALVFKQEAPTNLVELFSRGLSSKLNIEPLLDTPIKDFCISKYGTNLVDKDGQVGLVLDVQAVVANYINMFIFSTSGMSKEKINEAIVRQFRISNVVYEYGKVFVAFNFENKMGSKLAIKLPATSIVAANASLSIAKFKESAEKYVKENISADARVEFISFNKLLRLDSVIGTNADQIEQAKANQKLVSELSGNAGGKLNVKFVPVVVLDDSFAADKHVFNNGFLNEISKNVPNKVGIKRNLVVERLTSLLTDDVVSFTLGELGVAILPDVSKLVMNTYLKGAFDNIRLSVVTDEQNLAYSLSI